MTDNIIQLVSGLLFSKPLYEYAQENGENKAINVLIAGETFGGDSSVTEIFRRVFSCGQMTDDYSLNITVAVKNVDAAEECLNNDMPGIRRRDCLYNAGIIFEDIDSVSAEDYGYILVACENSADTESYYDKFVSQSGDRNVLVCAFGCKRFEHSQGRDFFRLTRRLNSRQNKLLQLEELNRYAYNCDFAYSQGIDERKEKPVFPETKELLSGDYNYLSSLAFVTHIPYKLKMCADKLNNGCSAFENLLDVISFRTPEYSRIYNILLFIEHRRWCAEKLADGWDMPDDEQLESAFKDGNDQRIKNKKLHPCLCIGTDEGCRLEEHENLWGECKEKSSIEEVRKYLNDSSDSLRLTELEIISLVLYWIANKRVNELCRDTDSMSNEFSRLSECETGNSFGWLRKAVTRLINEISGSVSLYRRTMKEAKEIAKGNADATGILEDIEKKLKIAEERNSRKNYFTIDGSMIDMIPFMMWYGKEYQTVVVISNGLATEDVVAPTMLCADKAVFIRDCRSEEYEKAINAYFDNRGNVTSAEFVVSDGRGIKATLAAVLEKCAGVPVVSISKNTCIMDINNFCEAVGNDIPLVTYQKGAIHGIKNSGKEFYGLLPKHFSVNEYTELHLGSITDESKYNEYNFMPGEETFSDLVKVYRDFSENKIYGKKKFHIWRNFSEKVESHNKDSKPFAFPEQRDDSDYSADCIRFAEELESKTRAVTYENGTIDFSDKRIRNVFSRPGLMLEMSFYVKAKNTGIFDDVQQGQKFYWDSSRNITVNNEVDVIMMDGMTPIFVSCKDIVFSAGILNNALYEIQTLSKHFNAIPVLVISDKAESEPDYLVNGDVKNSYREFLDRAKAMGVYVIGREALFDESKFYQALMKIKKNATIVS